MRFIRRTQTIVPSFGVGGACLSRAQLNETRRLADPTFQLSFPDLWNLADVRGALYAMHGQCCGFCNSLLPHNDRGDVEHFRPKGDVYGDKTHGGYWWLAYDFSNYLISCSRCNRTYKKTKFPLSAGGTRMTYAQRNQILAEPRLIIDPTLDPVEEWFVVDYNHKLCPIKARETLSPGIRSQVERTLEVFKVNKNAGLVRERIKIRDDVATAVLDSRFDDARLFAVRYRPHSLTAKQLLTEKAPGYLPSIDFEVSWLLGELADLLDLALGLGNVPGTKDESERQVAELLWSLAVLWKDPPPGTTIDIEDFLEEKGIVNYVRNYFDQLLI